MSLVGALLAAVAVCSLCLAIRSPSPVGRHLDLVAPHRARPGGPWRPVSEREIRQSGLRATPDRVLAAKIATSFIGALVAALVALFVPIGPAVVLLAAYAGWAGPSLLIAARATLPPRGGPGGDRPR